MEVQKLIIIGALRSGTNMLRDVLTSFDGVETWPCDEINYIWRYGNARYPSDEIPVSAVRPRVKTYIRQQFDKLAEKTSAQIIVEKTCANSLRVPFVDEIMENAKYIFIVRDGMDSVGSAKLRWTANLDLSYVLQKARFIPILDIPYYALKYARNRVF